ncbi:hypothetical protein PAXRUDRAFT_664331 [Paxillus rubicundulus Ve08.2h10]|uniref:Uncharacterized protein n=1 Tax=Paxillus rubicundulus Ve08.2h10 TaxID=930991 RepID=A0A0D0E8K7_9AGAM|nr:hypothetical protein PAXRUDRAFT_664331 [Paxillus rubicundulus Ve08.2h10]
MCRGDCGFLSSHTDTDILQLRTIRIGEQAPTRLIPSHHIPSRRRKVSSCQLNIHAHIDQKVDIHSSFVDGVWSSGTLNVSYLFLPISLSLRHLPRHWSSCAVFSLGAVGIRASFGVVQRIVLGSPLWSASLGLFTGYGCSYRTHSRFASLYSECLFPGTVQCRYSYLARWWTQSPYIHPVPFLHILPPLFHYHRLMSVSASFHSITSASLISVSRLAWRARDCTKTLTRHQQFKNKTSLLPSPCVYDDSRCSGCPSHQPTVTLITRLPAYLYAPCVSCPGLTVLPFLCSWILGLF